MMRVVCVSFLLICCVSACGKKSGDIVVALPATTDSRFNDTAVQEPTDEIEEQVEEQAVETELTPEDLTSENTTSEEKPSETTEGEDDAETVARTAGVIRFSPNATDLSWQGSELRLDYAARYFKSVNEGDEVLLLGDYCSWQPYHPLVAHGFISNEQLVISLDKLPPGIYRSNLVLASAMVTASLNLADWLQLHLIPENGLVKTDGETGQLILGITIKEQDGQKNIEPYNLDIIPTGTALPKNTSFGQGGGGNWTIAASFGYPVAELPGSSDFPSDPNEPRTTDPRTWYSTVYRGKYTGNWQERGLDSGSHPGVDILVPSGTEVMSVGDGVVETSTDHPTWGGLVVIRHVTEDGQNVWSVYAHLKSRWVEAGLSLSLGKKIGESGGDDDDPHAGFSTGAHLHFQLDTELAIFHPFWTQNQVDEPDDGTVANATLNPIKWLTGKIKSWLGVGGEPPTPVTATSDELDGTLVKLANRPEVYLIDQGLKRHVKNELALISYGYRDEQIMVITADELLTRPTGDELDIREGAVFALPDCQLTYLYHNGEKHEITLWHQQRFPDLTSRTIALNHERYRELFQGIPLGAPADDRMLNGSQ